MDTNAPISNRSYEVINGTFSPYRSGSSEDVMIEAVMRTRVMPLGIGEDRTGAVALKPAFPNPATGQALIGYSLRETTNVTFTVTDLLGRTVRTISQGRTLAGDHTLQLDVQNLPAGVYVYSLQAGSTKLSRKLIVQH